MVDVAPLKPINNIDILNAIRGNATREYQERIPNADKANIQQTLNDLYRYVPQRNEFVDALVNRIGLTIATNKLWTNPLAKFKLGMVPFGDTIEEIMVGIAKAHTYDPDREYMERDLYGSEANEVQSSFHRLNRQDYYKVTIKDSLLRRAFLNEDGLFQFTSSLMASATNGDQLDEFLLMANLFNEYDRLDGFFKINVPNIAGAGSNDSDAKEFLRKARALADTLPFYSRHYNAAHMPSFASPDELEMFITPEAKAAMDVNGLAALFNVGSAQLSSRLTIIPQENFGMPGVQAVVTTRDFFKVADTLMYNAQVANPVGLYNNYFFHHHQVVSASRFVPAVAFTTEAGSVIELFDPPVVSLPSQTIYGTDGIAVSSVERGKIYVVRGDAITNPVGGSNTAVRRVLVGDAELSPRTYLSETGVLSVSVDEQSTAFRIDSYATDNNEVTATTGVAVTGDKLDIWPLDIDIDTDKDGLFEATPQNVVKKNATTATVPSVEGVQYKKDGTNVGKGDTAITGTVVFTAVAKAKYELANGSTTSWSITAG